MCCDISVGDKVISVMVSKVDVMKRSFERDVVIARVSSSRFHCADRIWPSTLPIMSTVAESGWMVMMSPPRRMQHSDEVLLR